MIAVPSKPLSDDLEIWGTEDDVVLFDDASLGFALKLQPLDVACHSVAAINDLKSRICLFLNAIPEETDIQFIAEVGSRNEKTLDRHKALISDSAPESVKSLTNNRISVLKEEDENRLNPAHRLYVFARRRMRETLLNRSYYPKILSKKRYEAVATERLSVELLEVAKLRELISQGLSQLGLEPESLTGKEVLDLVYEQWNPGRDFPLYNLNLDEIKQGLTYTDIEISNRQFAIGDLKHRVISIKHLPDPTIAGMAQALRLLPQGSRLFVSIHVPDQTKELESLQTSRRIAYSMARGKRTGVSDLDSEAKLQDLETLLEQMIAQGEHALHASFNIVLRGKDESELDRDVQECLSTIRSLSGAEAMEETIASYFVFRELALPNARAKERTKKIKTSNLADLLPIFGPWEGMDIPRVILRNTEGGLFKLDPFSPTLPNANQLISGGSGAGKSFFTNILILQMLKEQPKIFFVDIGGSYKKLCENLDGSYVELGIGNGISINPFDLMEGENEPSPEKIKFLVGLVELMTQENDTTRLSKLERAGIETAVQALYRAKPNPRLSDLRGLLLQDETADIQKIGKILSSWVGDSPFGKLIDQPTSISYTGSLTSFDLKGLERYPELQAVALFLITDLVWREVQKDRGTMKFLVFDECWKLLKSEAGVVFIEEVFRTFRKYRASAIAISQALDDFAKSKISNAILTNCSMKWLLMQPEVDATRLEEVLNLNPSEIEIVKSLHQVKGSYSQAFLIADKNRTVVVTESLPIEYWLATTDPAELALIDKHHAEHPDKSRWEVLTHLSNQYPRGLSALQKGTK